MFIEDIIGEIPKGVNERGLEIIRKGGSDLEKWLLHQSYQVQKRNITQPGGDFYRGEMVYIRVLLDLATRSTAKMDALPQQAKKENDPLEGVQFFIKGKKDESPKIG